MSEPQRSLTFEQLLEEAELPDPGPEYYEARRKLWLSPRTSSPTPSPLSPSKARDKLEEVLSQPNAIYNPEVWNNGLERVWRGLSSGGKLKTRLPLNMIIKIVHASWLRDRTWPTGMKAPSSDDDQAQPAAATSSTAGSTQPEMLDTPQERRPIPIIATSELVEPPSPRMITHRHNRGR